MLTAWKLPFATAGNYSESIETFALCDTVETLIFFKLHTRYKYCIEQPFASTLGWILMPLSLLNRYFHQKKCYWLQRCYLQDRVLRNSQNHPETIFFPWLLKQNGEGAQDHNSQNRILELPQLLLCLIQKVFRSAKLKGFQIPQVRMKVFTLA